MAKITLKRKESAKDGLRRLSKILGKGGFFQRVEKNSHFIKPSEERRLAEKERLKTIKIAQKKSPDTNLRQGK